MCELLTQKYIQDASIDQIDIDDEDLSHPHNLERKAHRATVTSKEPSAFSANREPVFSRPALKTEDVRRIVQQNLERKNRPGHGGKSKNYTKRSRDKRESVKDIDF